MRGNALLLAVLLTGCAGQKQAVNDTHDYPRAHVHVYRYVGPVPMRTEGGPRPVE
jgi:hypothetical protein